MKKSKRLGVVITIALAVAGTLVACRLMSKEPQEIAASGQCHRKIKGDKMALRVDVDSDNLGKALVSGLNIVKRVIDRTVEVVETAPRREITSNVSISYSSKSSDGTTESKDIEMPLSASVPEVSAEEFAPDGFFDDIAKDMPSFDEVVSADRKYTLSAERLDAEYRKCYDEALDDARAKAGAIAEGRGLTIGGVVSAARDSTASLSASDLDEKGEMDIDVRLDVVFSAS